MKSRSRFVERFSRVSLMVVVIVALAGCGENWLSAEGLASAEAACAGSGGIKYVRNQSGSRFHSFEVVCMNGNRVTAWGSK